MSTEKKRFISSELEDLLKEVEEDHKKSGEIIKKKKEILIISFQRKLMILLPS